MNEGRFSKYCANCRKSLAEIDSYLFVESDVGRCFCSESCIQDYFVPISEHLEAELHQLRSEEDLVPLELNEIEHFRNLTLHDPDEVWVDQKESGDQYFTFMSHQDVSTDAGNIHFSYIVICLTLEGQPSFIFLSFVTKDKDLVAEYRKGSDLRIHDEYKSDEIDMAGLGIDEDDSDMQSEDTESYGSYRGEAFSDDATPIPNSAARVMPSEGFDESKDEGEEQDQDQDAALISLSVLEQLQEEGKEHKEAMEAHDEHLTELEVLHDQIRKDSDIDPSQFRKFAPFLDEALDDPDEIWNFTDDLGKSWLIFMFAAHNQEGFVFSMIVVCGVDSKSSMKGTLKAPIVSDPLQIHFAFPTVDAVLVDSFRKGKNSLYKSFANRKMRLLAA